MTILKHNPFSVDTTVFNQGFSLWSLTLTEGNRMKFVLKLFILGKLEEDRCWISSLCQDENEWSDCGKLLINDVKRV